MTKLVPLSRGLFALVDDEDFNLVKRFVWQYDGRYAITGYMDGGRHRVLRMHRLILSPRADEVVDHINNDGIDNRRSNLRLATPALNAQNHRQASIRSKTGVLGVWLSQRPGRAPRYVAQIKIDGRTKHLGSFKTIQEAHAVFKAAKRRFHLFSPFNGDGGPVLSLSELPERLRGEQINTAKLTGEQVIAIRLAFRGGVRKADLARLYGVSHMHIRRILDGQSWKHIGADALARNAIVGGRR